MKVLITGGAGFIGSGTVRVSEIPEEKTDLPLCR
jgi:UDP-glucose 4-epimerase